MNQNTTTETRNDSIQLSISDIPKAGEISGILNIIENMDEED